LSFLYSKRLPSFSRNLSSALYAFQKSLIERSPCSVTTVPPPFMPPVEVITRGSGAWLLPYPLHEHDPAVAYERAFGPVHPEPALELIRLFPFLRGSPASMRFLPGHIRNIQQGITLVNVASATPE
jgi:hypothetical protein